MENAGILTGRKAEYDYIRIVALLMIVLVHASAYMVLLYRDSSSSEFIIGNIFNGISRAGVPMFVMLSGALLLKEDKPFDTRSFYRKSLRWMILLLIGWVIAYGVFYALILPQAIGEETSLEQFTAYVLNFSGSSYPHLWYMFMVVGLYLIIPVLRLFVKRENRNYIFWLIIGCIILQFVVNTLDVFVPEDSVISVSGFAGKFHLECMTGYMGYILLGWYVSSFEMEKKYRYILYAAGVAALVFSIIVVQNFIATIPSIRAYMYSELALPPFIYGLALFVLIRQGCSGKEGSPVCIKKLSDCCFGVFIAHVFYLELFTRVLLPYDSVSWSPLVYIPVSYCLVVGAALLTVLIVGKIPYLKKIFYFK